MAKMRTYTIYDGEEVKTVESLSYKRTVKSYQTGAKSKVIRVEWETKRGEAYEINQPLPIGRKKKLGR